MARLLIIEDDAQTCDMLRQMLERAGYEVVEARDGRAGLYCYQTASIDVVILDMLIPEQNGFALIKALREGDPTVKIIAISGCGQTGTLDFLRVAEHLGAQRTLQKPFLLQELLSAVRDLIQGEDEGPQMLPGHTT